jgi:hypothetical protein
VVVGSGSAGTTEVTGPESALVWRLDQPAHGAAWLLHVGEIGGSGRSSDAIGPRAVLNEEPGQHVGVGQTVFGADHDLRRGVDQIRRDLRSPPVVVQADVHVLRLRSVMAEPRVHP